MRLGILTSHPIQYQAPWFRGLSKVVDLEVFFAHRQTATQQGSAGFGVAFDWDVDLLSGYSHRFLKNVADRPGVNSFSGCDTPEIAEVILNPPTTDHRPPTTDRFDAFIVSGWYLKSYWQAIRACRRAGVPVFVRGDSQLRTPRSPLKRLVMEVRQRWLLREFDGFLSVGKRNREYLEHYGVSPRKIFFAPHFVDNEWFAAKSAEVRGQRSEIRGRWGANEQTLVVLFVGKFQPIKRPQDILHALAALNAQPSSLNCMAVFVGSGEMETDLQELASSLAVVAHFEGFKNQTELPRYYVAADVLVLPSESETWGLVVNEAMACGLPAIVSDAVGCAPDLIEEGKTGFTFPVENVTALSQRLHQMAELRKCGRDFRPALTDKMRIYSVDTAVGATVRAMKSLSRLRRCRNTSASNQ